jgi:hypothetical protein
MTEYILVMFNALIKCWIIVTKLKSIKNCIYYIFFISFCKKGRKLYFNPRRNVIEILKTNNEIQLKYVYSYNLGYFLVKAQFTYKYII